MSCYDFYNRFLLSVEAPVLSVVSERSTSISLSWTSAGSVVDIYEVMWHRDTSGECSTEDESSANITDGLTSYVITGVEEHSYYSISMRASNIAGSTEISNTVRAMTLQSGWEYNSLLLTHTMYVRSLPLYSPICCSSFFDHINSDLHQYHCPVGICRVYPPKWGHNRLLNYI